MTSRSKCAWVLVAAAAALGAAGCRGPDWRVKQLYGGPTSTDVLAQPETVLAYRLDPSNPAKDPSAAKIGDFAIVGDAVSVGAADAAELSSVLLDPDTYDWHRAKGCEFTPGVGLRLLREGSRVDIVLCFACDELMIFRHGQRVGMEDFDDARPRLLAVVKRLFPADAKIQALGDRR